MLADKRPLTCDLHFHPAAWVGGCLTPGGLQWKISECARQAGWAPAWLSQGALHSWSAKAQVPAPLLTAKASGLGGVEWDSRSDWAWTLGEGCS